MTKPPAMTLGNMREMGIRAVDLFCSCGHEGNVVVEAYGDDVEIPSLAGIFRCSQCGAHPRVRPDRSRHNVSGKMR